MAQKYDLTDIGNALSRVMDNPMTKIIRSNKRWKCKCPKVLRYLWSNSCKPFRNTYRIHARRIDCL